MLLIFIFSSTSHIKLNFSTYTVSKIHGLHSLFNALKNDFISKITVNVHTYLVQLTFYLTRI